MAAVFSLPGQNSEPRISMPDALAVSHRSLPFGLASGIGEMVGRRQRRGDGCAGPCAAKIGKITSPSLGAPMFHHGFAANAFACIARLLANAVHGPILVRSRQ